MEWISIGRLTRTHGLKGELKFHPSDHSDVMVQSGQPICLGKKLLKIKSIRGINSPFILKLDGVNDIETAKELAGQEVKIAREDFEPLPKGEFYRFEIEGLKVFDDTGKYYGFVEEIVITGSNDVYVVRGEGKEWLIPMIDTVVKTIDLEKGKLIFHCVEGLFEDTSV